MSIVSFDLYIKSNEISGLSYEVQKWRKMIKILFVCHGNICRSAMAEYIMKDKIENAGLSSAFFIASAATSTEEIGNPVYPPARRVLAKHGIHCEGHAARQIRKSDYDTFDLLIGMDYWNMRNMERAFSGDPAGKLHMMSEFGHFDGEVDDPWYTGRFDEVYRQLDDACNGLIERFGKKTE